MCQINHTPVFTPPFGYRRVDRLDLETSLGPCFAARRCRSGLCRHEWPTMATAPPLPWRSKATSRRFSDFVACPDVGLQGVACWHQPPETWNIRCFEDDKGPSGVVQEIRAGDVAIKVLRVYLGPHGWASLAPPVK